MFTPEEKYVKICERGLILPVLQGSIVSNISAPAVIQQPH